MITGLALVSFCFLFAANLVILNNYTKIVPRLRPFAKGGSPIGLWDPGFALFEGQECFWI